ncbi:hypothetical protein BDY17DRAFT_32778 [Neohortaea acidophila]|uniref:Uncharacterized protein n=1 Tax=Neohortaea acidophila TaxID=245834 RepID=A0A6A6PJF9_9PEZI|nr:uncharacterized protein BDY17DRAFT_32778 [Neohortaea acidophila]KAF2480132.1 hypothetical protein BDY17DRAFT_32778 [Neohortaea acidophila]
MFADVRITNRSHFPCLFLQHALYPVYACFHMYSRQPCRCRSSAAPSCLIIGKRLAIAASGPPRSCRSICREHGPKSPLTARLASERQTPRTHHQHVNRLATSSHPRRPRRSRRQTRRRFRRRQADSHRRNNAPSDQSTALDRVAAASDLRFVRGHLPPVVLEVDLDDVLFHERVVLRRRPFVEIEFELDLRCGRVSVHVKTGIQTYME